jgi:hypothetical protein
MKAQNGNRLKWVVTLMPWWMKPPVPNEQETWNQSRHSGVTCICSYWIQSFSFLNWSHENKLNISTSKFIIFLGNKYRRNTFKVFLGDKLLYLKWRNTVKEHQVKTKHKTNTVVTMICILFTKLIYPILFLQSALYLCCIWWKNLKN